MSDRHHKCSFFSRSLLAAAAALLVVLPATSAVAQADFDSPKDKLAVLAPLVAEKVAATNGKEPTAGPSPLLARTAEQTGIHPKRLELWLDLLLSHGREGLVSLTDAEAGEMAKQVQGSWAMINRFMGEEVSEVRTRMYNDLLELREGAAKIRSLTVEAGTLDMGDPPNPEMGNEFILAAYGTITQSNVTGLEYGLAEGETGVLQVFEGEFIGINFPGIPPKGVTVTLESLWVKQGDVYRTVFFHHTWRGITELIRHLLEPGDTQITSWANRFTLGYSNFDSVELYERISGEVLVGDIDEFFAAGSRDPKLFDPAVHLAAPTGLVRQHRPLRRPSASQ